MKKKKIDENYIDGERKKIEEKDINHALTNEEEIKKKVSRLGKFKQQINLLFSMLKDYKNKKYTSVPWLSIAAITFALLYLLNPLDFMPDFIPFIGYVDDASIIGITLKLISEDLEAYQKWKEKSHLD
ncbi:MAG: YkvA family protein [Psychroflexus maritimus]